jgi:carbonic anhydrase
MIHAKIEGRLPQDEAVDGLDLGAIETLEKRVGDDVEALRNAPYVRPELAEKTFGYVYDIMTGELRRVDG